jgi:hypothetical protein
LILAEARSTARRGLLHVPAHEEEALARPSARERRLLLPRPAEPASRQDRRARTVEPSSFAD